MTGPAVGRSAAGREALRADSGSATVWLLTVIAVLVAGAGFATCLGAGIVTRHRAAAAADAAALAAAGAVTAGDTAACTAARRVAEANGATLRGCSVVGPVVEVRAAVRPPRWLLWLGAVTAIARAGPADISAPIPITATAS